MKSSFVVMADTHFAAPGTGEDGKWWNKTLKSWSPEIADAIVNKIREVSPDFVIHCGDFTDAGDIESFKFGKSVMDRLPCPYYITLGNHDTYHQTTWESITQLFENSDREFYYYRDLLGIRFFFLNSAYWITKDGKEFEFMDWDIFKKGEYSGIGLSQEELQWLRRELKSSDSMPKIIVTHPPIFSKPTYPVGSLPGGKPVKEHPSPYSHFMPDCVYRKELLGIIACASNVKAVFTGHWHIFDTTFKEGVFHCQTGSLIEFPFEMRLVEVDNRSFSMTTIGLNDKRFQEASLVEEWQNKWIAGEHDDRELNIDLI